MSEGITPGIKQFILPFSVLSENRKEPFTFDLEVATVFSLAEVDRAKGGGFLSKRPEEKTVFIAKIGYPLWLFPWSETTLIFDGLNRSKYTLPYAVIPDVKAFMENLKRGSKTRETHLAFLSDHINYFQTPVTEKGVLINGLIREPEFLGEFDSYRHEAIEITIDDQPSNVALLSPIIDESTISSTLDELKTLHLSFKEDIDRLYRCMKFMNKATRHYINVLRSKAKAVKEEFDVKINAQEEIVAPRVAHLKEDYDHQIIESAKSFERQLLPVQKEKVKLEKSREHALTKIEHYKLEAKTRAEMDDSVGEQKWKEKSSETKKELSEIEDQLKQTEKALKDLEERKSLEIFNLRSELEAKIKEARQPLLELESSRDAKILICKQEIETLEQQTKLIIEHIGRTAKLRETSIANFVKLGVKQDPELKDVALFYVPFYVACYQVESKKRYLILPPSEANAIGLSTKLKGALGRAKIKQLLVPRFKVITSLMDTIQVLAQQNAVFETEMREMGGRTNILTLDSMSERIQKGLEYITKEGWLSEKEHQDLSQKIT
jgi:DNA polymerase III alpha subunit (gram-positive type)